MGRKKKKENILILLLLLSRARALKRCLSLDRISPTKPLVGPYQSNTLDRISPIIGRRWTVSVQRTPFVGPYQSNEKITKKTRQKGGGYLFPAISGRFRLVGALAALGRKALHKQIHT